MAKRPIVECVQHPLVGYSFLEQDIANRMERGWRLLAMTDMGVVAGQALHQLLLVWVAEGVVC